MGLVVCPIYGGKFDDEAFIDAPLRTLFVVHGEPWEDIRTALVLHYHGQVSHLDGKHVVFGRAVSGVDIVQAIENTEVDDPDASASLYDDPCRGSCPLWRRGRFWMPGE